MTAPPQDVAAEESLLGAMLISAGAVGDALEAGIEPADFYRPAHAETCRVIFELARAGESVDVTTVSARLNGGGPGRQRLLELEAATPASANAAAYATIVRDRAARRALMGVGYELVEAARAGAAVGPLVAQLAALTTGGVDDSTLHEVDLSTVLAEPDDAERPTVLRRTDGRALLYRRRVNEIHGEPGNGKTMLALAAVAGEVAAGRTAVVVDVESDARTTARRLAAMGAGVDELARVRYLGPSASIGPAEVAAIVDRAENASVVVFDSVSAGLARDGIDENDNGRVLAWWHRVLVPIARAGAALIAIDHVTKNAAERARGARGAGAKLAAVDGVTFELRTDQSFSRTKPGHGRLIVAKDRDGHVGAVNETAAVVHFRPDSGSLTVELDPPASNDEVAFRPTVLMERMSRALEVQPVPINRTDVLDLVSGNASALRTALRALVAEGYIAAEQVGREKLHRSIRPFRDDDGPRSNDGPTTVQDRPPDDDGPRSPRLLEPGTLVRGPAS